MQDPTQHHRLGLLAQDVERGIEVVRELLDSSPELRIDDRHAIDVLILFAIASLDNDCRSERSRRGAIMLTVAIFAAVVWLLALVILLCAAGTTR